MKKLYFKLRTLNYVCLLLSIFVISGCGNRMPIDVSDSYSGFITDIQVYGKSIRYLIEDELTKSEKSVQVNNINQEFKVGDFVHVTNHGTGRQASIKAGSTTKSFDRLSKSRKDAKWEIRNNDMRKADYMTRLSGNKVK